MQNDSENWIAMYKANLGFMWSVWCQCQCVVDMTGYSHTASVCFELQCSSPFREYTSLFCIYLKFWIFLQSTLGPWNYLNFKPAFEVFKVLKNGGPWKSWNGFGKFSLDNGRLFVGTFCRVTVSSCDVLSLDYLLNLAGCKLAVYWSVLKNVRSCPTKVPEFKSHRRRGTLITVVEVSCWHYCGV